MMKRDECLDVIARHHTNEIVVAVYQAAFQWVVIKPDAPNCIATGAMGQGSSHGLGFALGMPRHRVLVLDGDGSLLMNLGTLVTIATAAPPNLVHFVCENGTYEANGGHPIPGKDVLSFAGMASAAGYREVHEFSELDKLDAALPGILKARGPVFVTLKIVPGKMYPENFGYMHSPKARADFKRALKRLPG